MCLGLFAHFSYSQNDETRLRNVEEDVRELRSGRPTTTSFENKIGSITFLTAGTGILWADGSISTTSNSASSDPTKVAKAGDTMTGQLTTTSTITIQGNAFSVGGSTLVVNAGRIGIGTASPLNKVSILDTASTTNLEFGSLANTRAFAQSYSRASSAYRAFDVYAASGTLFAGTAAATPAVAWDISGNVGIGTASPGTLLDVNGTATIRGATTVAGSSLTVHGDVSVATLTVTAGTNTDIKMCRLTGNNPYNAISINGVCDGLNVGTLGTQGIVGGGPSDNTLYYGASTHTWYSDGSFTATILSNGNFGIGTASPAKTLSVNGEIQTLGAGIRFSDGTLQNSAAVTAATQLISNNVDGTVIGTRQWYIYAVSRDGTSQSSGCVVAVGMSGTGTSDYAIFTSTTDAALATGTSPIQMGVLTETCSPGSACRIGMGGFYRVFDDNLSTSVINNNPKFTTTRCKTTATAVASGYFGRYLSATTAADGSIYISLGGL